MNRGAAVNAIFFQLLTACNMSLIITSARSSEILKCEMTERANSKSK